MRMTMLALVGVALATSAAAAYAPKPPPKSDTAAAPIWTVDKAASRLKFKATANNVGFDGLFKAWDAQIAFDAKNLKGSHAMVSVAMASVVTGDPTRDQMLPTPDWFDVGKFGKSTFETTSIAPAGADHYVANGFLTMHGVRKPLSLPFTLKIDRDTATMNGQVTLNRMDYSLGHGQAGGPETVAPQVTVIVNLVAHKAH